MEKRINEKLVKLTDKQINTVLQRSQSVERLVNKSDLKIKPEVTNSFNELRLIIKLQSLKLSSHV
jgi:hypothetical protein